MAYIDEVLEAVLDYHTALDNPHAGMLLSLKGDLRISQIVNPAKGCIMAFPKGILPIDFE